MYLFHLQADSRIILSKLITKYPSDIDASILLKILKGHWKAYLIEKPSLELCRHLVMLRDYNISGRINLMEIPVLLHMLHFWKVRKRVDECTCFKTCDWSGFIQQTQRNEKFCIPSFRQDDNIFKNCFQEIETLTFYFANFLFS